MSVSVDYAKDVLKKAWDAPTLDSAVSAIRAAWEELDRVSEYQIVELDGDWEVSRPGEAVATFSGIGAEQAARAYAHQPKPIVSGYKDDLLSMYESYAEDDGLPAWDKLTPKQQEAAIAAVVSLHENVDEYHAMADAIEEAAPVVNMRYYYIEAPPKRHEVTCTHVWRCTPEEDTISDPGEPGTPQGIGCCASCGAEGEIIYRGPQ